MLWGLWMDAERLGSESRAAREHPEWLAAAANTSSTANSAQNEMAQNTPTKATRQTSAASWTMATRLPVWSAMWPQMLGAKMRMTWSRDMSTPIWKALNSRERRYRPQNGAMAPTKAK
jgi:hypothetical protein